MVVISDTSPILNLAAIDSLDLLGALYPAVTIPPTVRVELSFLASRHRRFAVAAFAELPAFLRIEPLSAAAEILAAGFREQIDAGEAEALALAIALKADLLLVDERAARTLALRHGLRTRGLLGVLIAAKRRALLPMVAPLLERLANEAGFYMSAQLRADVLRSAGEVRP